MLSTSDAQRSGWAALQQLTWSLVHDVFHGAATVQEQHGWTIIACQLLQSLECTRVVDRQDVVGGTMDVRRAKLEEKSVDNAIKRRELIDAVPLCVAAACCIVLQHRPIYIGKRRCSMMHRVAASSALHWQFMCRCSVLHSAVASPTVHCCCILAMYLE